MIHVCIRNPSNCVIPQGSGGSAAGSPITDDKFINIAGDVTNKADVDKVFAENKIDAVIVALGGKTSDVGETMLTDGTVNIIAAMKENDVKRIAVVTVRHLILINHHSTKDNTKIHTNIHSSFRSLEQKKRISIKLFLFSFSFISSGNHSKHKSHESIYIFILFKVYWSW